MFFLSLLQGAKFPSVSKSTISHTKAMQLLQKFTDEILLRFYELVWSSTETVITFISKSAYVATGPSSRGTYAFQFSLLVNLVLDNILSLTLCFWLMFHWALSLSRLPYASY